MIARYAAAAMSLFVFACSSTAETGETGGGTPSQQDARCVGTPVEAYDVDDSASCAKQGAEWDSVYDECRGTTFGVHCSRADEYGLSSADDTAAMCLDMPGCGWTEDDGSVTKPSGSCEGTKTPCNALDEATCGSQTGCSYFSEEGCVDKNGFNWLDNVGCGELQIANNVSYSIVKSACQRAQGCSWVD